MEQPPENLSDIDSIESIETARMALRWALERLSAIEKGKTEAEARFAQESKQRLKVEDEYRNLEMTLDRRVAQAEQRAKALSKLRLDQADQRERSLAERQAEFEQFWQAQKLHWDENIRGVRDQIEQQAEMRLANLEKILKERHSFGERAWEQEKALLTQELEAWKQTNTAQRERIHELEKRLASSASAPASPAETVAPAPPSEDFWAEQNQRLVRENARLLEEAAQWQRKNQEHFERAQQLERSLALPDREAQRETARLTLWQAELEKELEKWRQRADGQVLQAPAPPGSEMIPANERKVAAASIEAQNERLDEAQVRLTDLQQRLDSAEKGLQQQSAFALGRSRLWDQERAQLINKLEEWRGQAKDNAERLERLSSQWSAEKSALSKETASLRRQREEDAAAGEQQKAQLTGKLRETQQQLEANVERCIGLEHRQGQEQRKAQESVLLAQEQRREAEAERDAWQRQVKDLNARIDASRREWDEERRRLLNDLEAARRQEAAILAQREIDSKGRRLDDAA